MVALLIISYRALASHPFRFIVGEERAEFTLHSDLVARQSKKLDLLINKDCYKESVERTAVWVYVDKATFTRFAQFIYCGDYDAEKPRSVPTEKEDVPVEEEHVPAEEEDPFDWGTPIKKKKKKPQPISTVAIRDFKNRQYKNKTSRLLIVEENTDPTTIYREVFLSHARLHAFADYHGIEPLMQMTLYKLHQQLCVFRLSNERKGDILELLRFCFPEGEKVEETGEKHTEIDERCDDGCAEGLKDLVAAYVACHMKELWDAEFESLYLRCPELIVILTTSLIDQTRVD